MKNIHKNNSEFQKPINLSTEVSIKGEQPAPPKPHEFNLGDIHIFQPVDDLETVHIRFNVPMSFVLHKQREMNEYERLTREEVRLKMSLLFQITQFIGVSLVQDDVRVNDAAEWLIFLSAVGESLTEALDIVEMDFAKHFENAEVKNEKEN